MCTKHSMNDKEPLLKVFKPSVTAQWRSSELRRVSGELTLNLGVHLRQLANDI
jgi:hypothetical protein